MGQFNHINYLCEYGINYYRERLRNRMRTPKVRYRMAYDGFKRNRRLDRGYPSDKVNVKAFVFSDV